MGLHTSCRCAVLLAAAQCSPLINLEDFFCGSFEQFYNHIIQFIDDSTSKCDQINLSGVLVIWLHTPGDPVCNKVIQRGILSSIVTMFLTFHERILVLDPTALHLFTFNFFLTCKYDVKKGARVA